MKNKLIFFICLIVIAGGAFYGGMKYSFAKNKNSASLSGGMRNFQDFQNMSSEERQQRMQEMGGAKRAGQDGAGFGSGNLGEIIAKDETSITIKLRDGGSKIIFFSDATKISKFIEGSIEDLTIGDNIMASGEANSDGSIVAENIQLRPDSF